MSKTLRTSNITAMIHEKENGGIQSAFWFDADHKLSYDNYMFTLQRRIPHSGSQWELILESSVYENILKKYKEIVDSKKQTVL